MSLINIPFGFMGSTGAGDRLLDLYGSEVGFALSTRKLSSTYTGNCMEVTRDSDSTTLDIGFAGDSVNTTAITNFCTGTVGRVTKWYDQTGGGNYFADDNGPVIYSGSIKTSRGLPACDFDGGLLSEGLHYQGGGAGQGYEFTGSYSYFIVSTGAKTSNSYMFGSSVAASKPAIICKYTGTNGTEWYNTQRQLIDSNQNNADVQQISIVHDGTNTTTCHYSGSQVFSVGGDSLPAIPADVEAIGGDSPTGNVYGGKMSEFIFYNNEKTSDQSAIATNQNDYYQMY